MIKKTVSPKTTLLNAAAFQINISKRNKHKHKCARKHKKTPQNQYNKCLNEQNF